MQYEKQEITPKLVSLTRNERFFTNIEPTKGKNTIIDKICTLILLKMMAF